ncbi:MAG: hypothetical protein NZ703_02785 [Gemmataceae bacterium]|nr:hypothetical protein [Gemmataceae bacterium]
MSQEPRTVEAADTWERLSDLWRRFTQGKIISYRWMAGIVIAITVAVVTWYILSERRAANSARWTELAQASTLEALKRLAEDNRVGPTMAGKAARLQWARSLLSDNGLELLQSGNAEARQRGAENIEKARELYLQLQKDFARDPIVQAECWLALAKAEAALVGVPAKPDQLTEFKGSVGKVKEYLQQFVAAAEGTSWAKEGEKLLQALQKEEDEFVTIQRSLWTLTPAFPSSPPLPPLPPTGGGEIPTLPVLPGGDK